MKGKSLFYEIKSLEKIIIRKAEDGRELNCKDVFPTPTQIQIIEYIMSNGGRQIYQKDLEEILGLRRATVSGVLQTMEKNGLIERIINEEDTREKKIKLNDLTKKIYLKSKKRIEQIEKIATEGISKSEYDMFYNVIKKMRKNVENFVIKERNEKC